MKIIKAIICMLLTTIAFTELSAQENEIHLNKVVLHKKEKKVFKDRDSSTYLIIDTLIMDDKSALQFLGKKDVKIIVKHAEIGNNVYFSGLAGKNNASNFDIDINFQKLGSLGIIARGQNATNGMRTYPNGDAGNITVTYNKEGIAPQTTQKKKKNYLAVDTNPGGLTTTPSSELSMIYSRVKQAPAGLRGIPQGQIYSGSPGREGKVIIKSNVE